MKAGRVHPVIMLGPDLNNHGGMARSEKLILDWWDYKEYPIRLLVTHKDGSHLEKALAFFLSIPVFLYRMFFDDISITYAHFSIGASFYRKSFFVLVSRIFNKKIVIHCRSGEFGNFYSSKNRVTQMFIKYVLCSVDAIITLGETEKKIFNDICGDTVCVWVVHNSIPLPDKQAGLDLAPVVCTMGTLGHRKGTYDLLRAIPLVLEYDSHVKFYLCGDGEVQKSRQISIETGIYENVEFPGWVDGREKEEIYLMSSVYVLPSYFEGMPRSILEAMSYGLPVVSTRVNAIPSLVTHEVTGILIEPGDVDRLASGIIELLRGYDLRKRMGNAARNAIKDNYDVRSKLADLYHVFNHVLEKGHPLR